MLSPEETDEILNDFPNIKLSYETIVHKKVYPLDKFTILGIPEGKKCFAWFTIYNDLPTCFLMETTQNNTIRSVKIINACFSNEVSYGTILYGTFFRHLNGSFFAAEDIFLCKGNRVATNKIETICSLFKSDIKQLAYNNNFVVFGLPIISKKSDEFDNMLSSITYKINCIKYTSHNKNFVISLDDYLQSKMQKPVQQKPVQNKTRVLLCKPDIQNDIYHLYEGDEYVGLAGVPDYQTSKMLNKLFRIIKENDDLDALELSDDEEEFENEKLDKYVFLDKSYKMECIFNYRFKKWIPIKVV